MTQRHFDYFKDLSNSPPKGKLELENWRSNFVSMSKNELLEMISNLEVQLNEAEDKITMSTHLQVSKINCKSKTVLTLRILSLKSLFRNFWLQ